MGGIEIVGERFDGEDADYLDDGYEDAEGEDGEENDLFAFGELEFEEHREGGDHSVMANSCQYVNLLE